MQANTDISRSGTKTAASLAPGLNFLIILCRSLELRLQDSETLLQESHQTRRNGTCRRRAWGVRCALAIADIVVKE